MQVSKHLRKYSKQCFKHIKFKDHEKARQVLAQNYGHL